MKRYLLLILACACVSVTTLVGQNKFRIQEWKGHGEFIVPPKSKLVNGEGELRKNSRYHYLRIDGLKDDYMQCRSAIDSAKYMHDCEETIRTFPGRTMVDSLLSNFCRVRFCPQEGRSLSSLEIELDYQYIQPESFIDLSVRLFLFLTKYENVDQTIASGISQVILEKVFDVIPVHKDKTLSKYLHITRDGVSFMLLSPDMTMSVDIVTRIPVGSSTYFMDQWEGPKLFSFRHNEKGHIVQNIFTQLFSEKGGSSNRFLKNNTILQSSASGIQNSSVLSKLPYIALRCEALKRNNNNKYLSTGGDYGNSADNESLIGNSVLFHFNGKNVSDNDIIGIDASIQIDDESDKINKSVFGLRNSIMPLTSILINHQLHNIQINSAIANIRFLPARFKVFRMHNGALRKVRNVKRETILMPNDHIIYR